MRTAPAWVSRRIASEFGGRLRLRWSNRRQSWLIEQRVGHAAILEPPKRADGTYDTDSDRYIQARDGYASVLAITVGDRIACPRCHLTIPVPVMEFGEARCEYCLARNVDSRWRASYWPIDSEAIIEHLRKLDPERGGVERMVAEIDRDNARAAASKQRADDHDSYYGFYDHMVDQFPQFGYSGRTAAWEK